MFEPTITYNQQSAIQPKKKKSWWPWLLGAAGAGAAAYLGDKMYNQSKGFNFLRGVGYNPNVANEDITLQLRNPALSADEKVNALKRNPDLWNFFLDRDESKARQFVNEGAGLSYDIKNKVFQPWRQERPGLGAEELGAKYSEGPLKDVHPFKIMVGSIAADYGLSKLLGNRLGNWAAIARAPMMLGAKGKIPNMLLRAGTTGVQTMAMAQDPFWAEATEEAGPYKWWNIPSWFDKGSFGRKFVRYVAPAAADLGSWVPNPVVATAFNVGSGLPLLAGQSMVDEANEKFDARSLVGDALINNYKKMKAGLPGLSIEQIAGLNSSLNKINNGNRYGLLKTFLDPRWIEGGVSKEIDADNPAFEALARKMQRYSRLQKPQ